MVSIEGNLTQRSVETPITDLAFRLVKEFGCEAPDMLGCKNTFDNGKQLKRSTIFIHGDQGKIEDCVCIDFNVGGFLFLWRLPQRSPKGVIAACPR